MEDHVALGERSDGEGAAGESPDRQETVFEVNSSRGFTGWLHQTGASLAVTTYQVGKLLMFGVKPDGKLWVFNRNIGRCLGMALTGNEMWITSDLQIYRMIDALREGERTEAGEDVYYVPQQSFFTGDLDVHDLAIAADGRVLFANTLFNCIGALSSTHSFTEVWRPLFISRLAPEDRCHLNGLAMRDGKPAFVTAVAESDTFNGWRDQRQSGGIVIDIASNEIVCRGLSMPHSPRWHDGRLWLHNSGAGEFGWVDPQTGRFEPVVFAPGYLRGLSFVGNYAVMGLSKPRDNKTFSGLELDNQLARRKMEPRCGVYVLDLRSGAVIESLTLDGIVSELYDVAIIPGRRQPSCLGPHNPELTRTFSIG